MEIRFTAFIRKGNKNGTGLIYIPKDKIDSVSLGCWTEVEILENKFFTRIIAYSHKLGIYIPQRIVEENNLLGKDLEIQLKKVDGFHAPVASDGRIYLPYEIVEKEKLHHNDIISLKVIRDNKIIQGRYAKIYVT